MERLFQNKLQKSGNAKKNQRREKKQRNFPISQNGIGKNMHLRESIVIGVDLSININEEKKNDHIHGWHASERKFPHSYEMKGVYSIWLNSFHSFCFTFYHYIFTIRTIGSSGRAQYSYNMFFAHWMKWITESGFIIVSSLLICFFTYLRNVITFCIFVHVNGVSVWCQCWFWNGKWDFSIHRMLVCIVTYLIDLN